MLFSLMRSCFHQPIQRSSKRCRVTEGVLKSIVATELSGVRTLGLPGVNGAKAALQALRQVKAETVLVAFDADARDNPAEAGHLRELVKALRGEAYDIGLELWDPADGDSGHDESRRDQIRRQTQT